MACRLVLIATFVAAGAFFSTSLGAEEPRAPTVYMSKDLKVAGQLYDNWPKVTGAKPVGSHPLYPAEGKKQGPSTWRCKECHGWDYLGRDGRYASGSHFTGIAGIYASRKKNSLTLYKALTSKEHGHDFSPYLSSFELWALAGFIRDGLVDINLALTPEGKPRGDAEKGKALYGKHCASCHGVDGQKMDMEDAKGVQGVGFYANSNPQETLHKIRWGHPGSDMPSALVDKALNDQDTFDILSYCMKLK